MREISLSVEPGRYVVAVSGGVDSVVLLQLLRQMPDVQLVVAHFDHGIRAESGDDRRFVQALAAQNGLPFVFAEGRLGGTASEAAARDARYAFLLKVMREQGAQAIMTAHHEDDLLETAILNLLRGTGRKGLSSLKSNVPLLRPLLHVQKQTLRDYAIEHQLEWHEDRTNASTVYLRNYIRHKLLPRFDETARTRLRALLDSAAATNDEIDAMLGELLRLQPTTDSLDRQKVIMLPYVVSKELLAAWLRAHDLRAFDKKTIERLTVAAKTYAPGKVIDIDAAHVIHVEKHKLALTLRER